MNNNLVKGKIGELKVLDKLLELGHIPSVPIVDMGFDIILENGKRLQVKTSKKRSNKTRGYAYPVYIFNTWCGRKKYRGIENKRWKLNKNECDYLVCYAIEDNRFYIIPIEEITTINNLIVSLGDNHKYSKYLDAWRFLERDG